MPSRIAHPEDDIQHAVVAQLRARGVPGLVFFHVPNSSKLGGKRTRDGVPLEAIRLPSLGFRPGVSDLILAHAGKMFALELKTETGRVTKDQFDFIADMHEAGADTAIAMGLDAAIQTLEGWRLLRGKAI